MLGLMLFLIFLFVIYDIGVKDCLTAVKLTTALLILYCNAPENVKLINLAVRAPIQPWGCSINQVSYIVRKNKTEVSR